MWNSTEMAILLRCHLIIWIVSFSSPSSTSSSSSLIFEFNFNDSINSLCTLHSIKCIHEIKLPIPSKFARYTMRSHPSIHFKPSFICCSIIKWHSSFFSLFTFGYTDLLCHASSSFVCLPLFYFLMELFWWLQHFVRRSKWVKPFMTFSITRLWTFVIFLCAFV